jgi:hypothetical protein
MRESSRISPRSFFLESETPLAGYRIISSSITGKPFVCNLEIVNAPYTYRDRRECGSVFDAIEQAEKHWRELLASCLVPSEPRQQRYSTWDRECVGTFLSRGKVGDWIYSNLPARALYSFAHDKPLKVIVRSVICVGIRDEAIHDRLNRLQIVEKS